MSETGSSDKQNLAAEGLRTETQHAFQNVGRAADQARETAVTAVLTASETKRHRVDELPKRGRQVVNYLLATVLVAACSLLKFVLDSYLLVDSPFLLFGFAILLAAWRGGLGVGLYTTIAATLVVETFFVAATGSVFSNDSRQILSVIVFVGQGVLISALCGSRLRNERLLQNSGRELENSVAHRTMQLAQANLELQTEIEERTALQEDLRSARDSALESARLKSEFLANMSHEIRTPMNGVIGMTGLLLDTKLNDEQKRFAQTIRSCGESLLTIINDILDFSKVEAGKLDLETFDFNLRETVESLIEMFSGRAREQRNELAALIYSDVPLYLRGDAGRIRQILTNLIGNAIKFTKFGDILIRVEKIHEAGDRVHLKISVSDTGEGVSDEIQARLFQPFTQSDASTTRRYGGTGLGLSISKKLVELMNGEIGVESKLGKGSSFWFSLDLEKQPAAHPADEDESVTRTYPELAGKRVLIVDDNDVNREVLMYQTRSWLMETVAASDGVNAVNILEHSPLRFDLVILDLQMPIMDGIQTAEQFGTKNITPAPPIVMISSSSFKVATKKMAELGIRAFLNKPYRQNELLIAVCETLNIDQIESLTPPTDSDIHILATEEAALTAPSGDKAKRILIVEDNSVNQLVAQNLLRRFGYHSDVAANGKEALRALEIIPYDLVLMDCQMPEMDGYEATRAIRARHWAPSNVPIIALTAHVTNGEREKCLEAGMDDYISKPIEKEVLRQMVAYWLLDTNGTPFGKAEEQSAPIDAESDALLDVPAVDFSVLDDITDHSEEMKREVVEIYLAQMVVYLFELEQAIAENDAEKLNAVAHKAVGGSALCGMTAIVGPLRMLEELGRENRMSEALPHFSQAQKAFAAIGRVCREKILVTEEILCER